MLLLQVLASLTHSLLVPAANPEPEVTVTVDTRARTVSVVAGPFTIAGIPPGTDHAGHAMHDMDGASTPFLSFEWPVTGSLHEFQVRLRTGRGDPLDRRLIHHVNMMNLGRRQLLYDAVERLLAVGQETDDIRFPRTIGVPLEAGQPVGILAAWNHDDPHDINDVYLDVTFRYSNPRLSPRPLDVLVLYMDVNYVGPGETDSYDLPAGYSTRSHEFTMPIDGRLLVAGGHLHDYARHVELRDLESGKILVRLRARLDADGHIQGVERKLLAIRGDGLRLHAGRRYRLTAAYDNPTGATIPLGAMGIMAGLFVPSSLAEWPPMDPNHPAIRADIAALQRSGGSSGGGHHHDPSPP